MRRDAMNIIRALFCIAITGVSVLAQAPVSLPATGDAPELNDTIIKNTTTYVVAPTLVTDRQGNLIDGLQPAQFHLFDNGKEQNIQVDVSFQPISVVVAIEASSRVDAILAQIKHLGTLMPVVVGDHGEAAVIAFDSRIRLMQDFTNDPDKVKSAIEHITAGNSSSRMIDTVDRAVFMLRRRPQDNRKIILLVSETRDVASEGKLRETLVDAQLSNVLIYAVNITQLAVRLTEKPSEPRPDPIDITSRPTVLGQPSTPTSAAQNYGVQNQVQFAPLLKEIYTDTKRLFVDNPTEVLTKATGGTEVAFLKQRGLEDVIQRISTELRSQYLISYNPNNKEEPGFHEISVKVERSTYLARTRPGYWLAGGKGQ
jgi:VWFA-related protein